MQIDWEKLGFEYLPTKSHIRHTYENGKWDAGRLSADPNITLPISATCLHYGQAAFEGLKAFTCKDGKVRIFRPGANGARMNRSAAYMLAPTIPDEMFLEAVRRVVRDNIEYVPPYGSGGSLYIRPFIIGSGGLIGVKPSNKYEFMIFVVPVGAYYKGKINPVDALIIDDIDRAAPKGTGHIKLAGNYAAGLKPQEMTKKKHCEIPLFMDALTHQYVEEFGTSNFLAISKDGHYVTPESPSILGSVTNDSLMIIARDLGMVVERRKVSRSELPSFAEVGACGTAVVITPVGRIFDGDKVYNYGKEIGPKLRLLYDTLTGIQRGEIADKHGWLVDL
jgi:branched-chain amino acid aminotransferase